MSYTQVFLELASTLLPNKHRLSRLVLLPSGPDTVPRATVLLDRISQ